MKAQPAQHAAATVSDKQPMRCISQLLTIVPHNIVGMQWLVLQMEIMT